VNVAQTRRQGKDKVRSREDVLGVASIHCVACKGRLIAKIFYSVMTVPAVTIDTTHP
jgi:hypothetical protein